jgi:signal transduction histidine kinase
VETAPFNVEAWRPALETYGRVTRLTTILFDATAQIVCGPIPPSALFDALAEAPSDTGLFTDCAQACLRAQDGRATVTVTERSGLAVAGTALVVNDEIVGAAVAGYHLVDFPQVVAIQRLAAEAGVPFPTLWDVVRRDAPVSRTRFVVEGELLRVLGETILRETDRTRQYEVVASELRAAAAAKDEFMAVLSHELRTPLTPILGWARMLKLGDPSRVARAADVIERNARLQSKLVEDLLDLTRVAREHVPLDMRIVDLNDAIRVAVDAYLEGANQKGLALQVIDAGELLLMRADPNRLQQIVRNVIANALKFTPVGGRITVTLTKDAETGVVQIRDTGEGIAADFLPSVFDLFRQQERGTRRHHEGLGIGLALVKRLTELHGGQVAIASAGVGQGTEVTLRFPLTMEADRARPVPLYDPGGVRLKLDGLRVLIVDDMDDARESTQLILERLGADVVVASDGAQALEVVAAAEPDVVLCDLRMPHMDGFEFLRALRENKGLYSPPVIAITALASRDDHLRTTRAGFEGHLDKPFDDTGLLAAVGAVISRRRR